MFYVKTVNQISHNRAHVCFSKFNHVHFVFFLYIYNRHTRETQVGCQLFKRGCVLYRLIFPFSGTGTGYSVLQMIAAFESASGRRVPYRVVGRRAGDIAANYSDVGLSHRLLGWRAVKTLEDMCRDTWKWQSGNPEGFKKC